MLFCGSTCRFQGLNLGPSAYKTSAVKNKLLCSAFWECKAKGFALTCPYLGGLSSLQQPCKVSKLLSTHCSWSCDCKGVVCQVYLVCVWQRQEQVSPDSQLSLLTYGLAAILAAARWNGMWILLLARMYTELQWSPINSHAVGGIYLQSDNLVGSQAFLPQDDFTCRLYFLNFNFLFANYLSASGGGGLPPLASVPYCKLQIKN